MKYIRTTIYEIPNFKYFQEDLGWDICKMEDLIESLDDFSDDDLQDRLACPELYGKEDAFVKEIKTFSRVEGDKNGDKKKSYFSLAEAEADEVKAE